MLRASAVRRHERYDSVAARSLAVKQDIDRHSVWQHALASLTIAAAAAGAGFLGGFLVACG